MSCSTQNLENVGHSMMKQHVQELRSCHDSECVGSLNPCICAQNKSVISAASVYLQGIRRPSLQRYLTVSPASDLTNGCCSAVVLTEPNRRNNGNWRSVGRFYHQNAHGVCCAGL